MISYIILFLTISCQHTDKDTFRFIFHQSEAKVMYLNIKCNKKIVPYLKISDNEIIIDSATFIKYSNKKEDQIDLEIKFKNKKLIKIERYIQFWPLFGYEFVSNHRTYTHLFMFDYWYLDLDESFSILNSKKRKKLSLGKGVCYSNETSYYCKRF